MARSDRVRETITWKVTQFALGRPLGAGDAEAIQQIHEAATKAGGTYPDLITAIAMSDLVQEVRTEVDAMRWVSRLAWAAYSGAVACLLSLVFGPLECRAAEPLVKPLVPGLRVQRLPVDLTNINSLEYGPDGRLYAAGYDGRVHVLTDTDGDGVEDKAELYWSKAGDLIDARRDLADRRRSVSGCPRQDRLAQGHRRRRTGRCERTVVSGWERESHNSDTRNDAAGIALDAEGNLYLQSGVHVLQQRLVVGRQGQAPLRHSQRTGDDPEGLPRPKDA